MSVKIYPTVYQALFAQNYAKKHFNKVVGAKRDLIIAEQKKFMNETFKLGAKTALKGELESIFSERVKSAYYVLFQYKNSTDNVIAQTFTTTRHMVEELNSMGYKFLPRSYEAWLYNGKLIPAERGKAIVEAHANTEYSEEIFGSVSSEYVKKLDGDYIHREGNKLIYDGSDIGENYEAKVAELVLFNTRAIDYDFFSKGYFLDLATKHPKGSVSGYGITEESYSIKIPLAFRSGNEIRWDADYVILFFIPEPYYVYNPTYGKIINGTKFKPKPVLDKKKLPTEDFEKTWYTLNPLLGEIVTKLYRETAPIAYKKKIVRQRERTVAAQKKREAQLKKRREFIRSSARSEGMSELRYWKNVLSKSLGAVPGERRLFEASFANESLSGEEPKLIPNFYGGSTLINPVEPELSSLIVEPNPPEIFGIPETKKSGAPVAKRISRPRKTKVPESFDMPLFDSVLGFVNKKISAKVYFSENNPIDLYGLYYAVANEEWNIFKQNIKQHIPFWEFLKTGMTGDIMYKHQIDANAATKYYKLASAYFQNINY